MKNWIINGENTKHISNIPNKINLLNNPEFMKSLLVPLSYPSLGLITIGYFYGKDDEGRKTRTRRTRRRRRRRRRIEKRQK